MPVHTRTYHTHMKNKTKQKGKTLLTHALGATKNGQISSTTVYGSLNLLLLFSTLKFERISAFSIISYDLKGGNLPVINILRKYAEPLPKWNVKCFKNNLLSFHELSFLLSF